MRSEQLRGQPALHPRFSDEWINNDVATTASAFPSEPALREPSEPKGRSPAEHKGVGWLALIAAPYFKLNSAFTCAVTVTVCGANCSLGAGGAALAIADIVRAM
jgi:hypothetical protein